MELNYIGRARSFLSFYNLFASNKIGSNLVFGRRTQEWSGSIPAFDPSVNTFADLATATTLCTGGVKCRRYLVLATAPSGFTEIALPSLDTPDIPDGKYAKVQYNGQTYYAVNPTKNNMQNLAVFNLYLELHLYVNVNNDFTFRQVGFRDTDFDANALIAYENLAPQTVISGADGLTLKLILAF